MVVLIGSIARQLRPDFIRHLGPYFTKHGGQGTIVLIGCI
jgi:hypothetical protein